MIQYSLMRHWLSKNWVEVVLYLAISLFIGYISYYTIIRYQHIYASYFDLGIMNQTVYNTYKAITTFDFSRFLEMTDPMGLGQFKRMAIHNDLFLALLAPFYLIHAGPETLLFIQAFVVGLGALGVYGIGTHAFVKHQSKKIIALVFALGYLLYPPLGKGVIFEFHAVTLATTFLIFMFYFWLKRRFGWSLLFMALSLLTKEQVALTTFFFGGYALLCHTIILPKSVKHVKKIIRELRRDPDNLKFTTIVMMVSFVWFVLSIWVIIPYFRGSEHFALKYYDDGITSVKNVFHETTRDYLLYMFGPFGFISLLAPLKLLIALPEFAINLLSNNDNMRNIYYHYQAVITPFIVISAIYGLRNATKLTKFKNAWKYLTGYVFLMSVVFAVWIGPLPFSFQADTYAFFNPRSEERDINMWADFLKDEKIKVSASSQIAPIFTSRRYFYNFGKNYSRSDYIVIRLPEVYNYPEKDELIPVYEKLMSDPLFVKIFDKDGVVVYKKL